VLADARVPAVLAARELRERALREQRHVAGLDRVAECCGDRVAGAVADLEKALPRRAAAAGDAVAAVLARELHAELLEPVDRGGCLGREDLDEPPVRGLVAR